MRERVAACGSDGFAYLLVPNAAIATKGDRSKRVLCLQEVE